MTVTIIGITILVISIIGGILLASRNAPDRQRQTKILLFILFFWILTFIQLIVVAIGYSALNSMTGRQLGIHIDHALHGTLTEVNIATFPSRCIRQVSSVVSFPKTPVCSADSQPARDTSL